MPENSVPPVMWELLESQGTGHWGVQPRLPELSVSINWRGLDIGTSVDGLP